MILLKLLLFSLISGDDSLTKPHKHDRENFNYFTLQIPKQKVFNLEQVESVLNLEHVQRIGALEDWHLFRRAKFPSADLSNSQFTPVNKLSRRAQQVLNSISHFEEADPRSLNKRASIGKDRDILFPSLNMSKYDELGIKDPGFARQWHFHNTDAPGNDFNVTKLWDEGITGKNVIVGIIDDGIDYEHRDIKDNFYAESSYDFNDGRKLPMPMLPEDTHGTRCAGQIAGVKNDACGIGIAHEAKVAGIRILSKEISADQEAHAIGYGMQTNEIYSCSWGPPDDGRAMDRPPPVAQAALENAIEKGRGGKGNIYVFASGNGGFQGDDCNYDGYTNSIYSITVGSVDAFHNHPGYSESCTALLVSAYSSGVLSHRIYTSSSWKNQCTDEHGGTSAAAPFVAGVAALALQVRPDLTWRDMQYVSVKAAIPINTKDSSWDRTAVGRWYSPAFGYGKIDAYQFVQTAKAHELVRPQVKIDSGVIRVARPIPEGQGGVSSSFVVTRKMIDESKFGTVEHVTVTLNVQHQSRNNVRVTLKSPSNVVSTVIVPRPYDTSNQGYPDWRAMTVKHWSEDPIGDWTITVTDEMDPFATGVFIDWKLTIFGEESKTPTEIKPSQPKKDAEEEELKPSKAIDEKETESSKAPEDKKESTEKDSQTSEDSKKESTEKDSQTSEDSKKESAEKDSQTSGDSKKETEKENKEDSKSAEPKKENSTEKTETTDSAKLTGDNSETEGKNGLSTPYIVIFSVAGLGLIISALVVYRRYRGYTHLPKGQDLEMIDTPNEPHSPYHDDSVEVAFEAGISDNDEDISFTPLVHPNAGISLAKKNVR